MRRAHVVGAGLAGLAASVALARRGFAVQLWEGGAQAGGRCRSYHDPQLDMVIDNGNHLVLSGNYAVRDYLKTIGASHRLTGPAKAVLDFHDLRDGASWRIEPGNGAVPLWLFAKGKRVPGTKPGDYLALARLMRARVSGTSGGATIGATIRTHGALWERMLEPFLVSALNTPAREGSATLAGAVIRETLAKGGRACRPLVATPTLAAAFVDPAIAWLRAQGATIRLGRRLKSFEIADGRVAALVFAGGREAVAPGEPVVLAVPAWVATGLLPGLSAPTAHNAIVNAHYRIVPPAGLRPIVGVIGGTAEWVFAFPDRLSVTISAADRLVETDREDLARAIWADVARVHGLGDAMPRWQIVREKRATFAATPEQDALRPGVTTMHDNLFLCGDWTKTGLPATIEAAIRSGGVAARAAAGVED